MLDEQLQLVVLGKRNGDVFDGELLGAGAFVGRAAARNDARVDGAAELKPGAKCFRAFRVLKGKVLKTLRHETGDRYEFVVIGTRVGIQLAGRHRDGCFWLRVRRGYRRLPRERREQSEEWATRVSIWRLWRIMFS